MKTRVPFPRLILGFLLMVIGAVAHGQTPSALVGAPSPYLAMHAADPVAWRLWGPEAIDEARRKDKLLFVSSGNYSCYWCHVMQRDNFLDPRIANLINRNFIPVLVDSDLQPTLDAQFMEFLNRTLGYAGWPMQVFITPEGYLLAGAVYAPPAEFEPMLLEMASEWSGNRKELAAHAKQTAKAYRQSLPPVSDELEEGQGTTLIAALVRGALMVADNEVGGFGKQSKFPSAPQLQALLFAYGQTREIPLRNFLILTLDRMANGALRDHLGGGFFRYTTDRFWREPHFEKMLYDNAQLAILYLQAAQRLDRPDYEEIGRETLDFMLRELGSTNGGLVVGLAAVDKSSREGVYYFWNQPELKALLTPAEFDVISIAWDLNSSSRADGMYLPRYDLPVAQIAAKLGIIPGTAKRLLQTARKKLLSARQERTLPRDEKELAGLNGLALTAMVEGAGLSNGKVYRQAAQGLRDFLVKTMWNGKQLYRLKIGKPAQSNEGVEGTLEDYATVAKGLLAWSHLAHRETDSRLAGRLISEAWQRFHNEETGWQLEQRTPLPIESGVAALPDSALPSASATLLASSTEWSTENHDKALQKRIRRALNAARPLLDKNPLAYASYTILLLPVANAAALSE